MIHHVIVLKSIFSSIKMKTFYFSLSSFKRTTDKTILNRFILRDTETSHHSLYSVGTEHAHQIILERNIKLGLAGISLSPRSTSKLVIDSPRLMTLSAQNKKPTDTFHKFVFVFDYRIATEFDIDSSASHVRRNSYRSTFASLSDDFSFFFMILCIQDHMGHSFLFQI